MAGKLCKDGELGGMGRMRCADVVYKLPDTVAGFTIVRSSEV